MTSATHQEIRDTVEVMTERWAEIVATTGELTDGQILDSLKEARRDGLKVVIPGGERTFLLMHLLYMGEIEIVDKKPAPMTKTVLISEMMKKISRWASLDKESFIRDLLHWLTDKQLLIALNIAGVYFEDLKTEWLKGRNIK